MPGEALSLERLIRDGPPDGDLAAGLELVRLKILDQGIKSDGDGMVSFDSQENSSSLLILYHSHPCAFMYGFCCSARRSSKQMHISTSSTEELRQHTLRFATIPSAP